MDTSTVDFIISIGKSQDFPGDKLFEEFSRVLKPGGEIFVHRTLDAAQENVKVLFLKVKLHSDLSINQ